MTLCSMISTTALAYEDNNTQEEVSETLSSSVKSSKKTPESSGASSHEQETTALVDSGDCGDNGSNVQWALYESGTLYVYGSGNMKDYSSSSDRPYDSYRSQITNVVIESGVTSIGSNAFYDCTSLTNVTIPNSVTNIGNYAFRFCNTLASITIPNSVTTIGDYAFYECPCLTSISIPNSVASIGNDLFEYCGSLNSITVDSNNPNYSSDNGILFNKNKTTLIKYPEGKTATSYTIPDSVANIGNNAFFYCSNLKSIIIPNSVVSIGDYAFSFCTSLKNIKIPNSVASLGEHAFYECISLTSTIISNRVEEIRWGTFENCGSLTSVTIPYSVVSIINNAFNNCGNLKDIYYTGTEIDWSCMSIYDGNNPLEYAAKHYNNYDNYTYTLSYDMNGGNASIPPQTKKHGQEITLSSTKPARTGYAFIGWNTEKNAAAAQYLPNDKYYENKDVKLYAVWLQLLTNTSTVNNQNAVVGSSVKITGSAEGGTGNYNYEFYYKRQGSSSWSKFDSAYQKANTAALKPSSAGTFIVRTYAKDGKSAKVKDFTITFTPPLTNKTTVTTTTPKVGTAVKINGSATGGTGTYTYEFYYKRQGASSWSTFGTNYRTDTTATLKPSSAGSFDVRVYVKESSGKTAVKNFVITYSK